jgi:hypothetical protein
MRSFDDFKREHGIPEEVTEEEVIERLDLTQFNPSTARAPEWCKLLAVIMTKYNNGHPFVIQKRDLYLTARNQTALKMELKADNNDNDPEALELTLMPRAEAMLATIAGDHKNIETRSPDVINMFKKLVESGVEPEEAYHTAIEHYAVDINEKQKKEMGYEADSIYSKK